MKWRSMTFRVRAGEVPAVEKAIIAFVAKIADEPGTLSYESFRQADGVSYLHLMSFADDAAEEAHGQTEHAKRFHAELRARCDVQPVFIEMNMVSGAGR